MTSPLLRALRHGRHIAWVRALSTAACAALLLGGVWSTTPHPWIVLACTAPFFAYGWARLIVVGERPFRALPALKDKKLRAEIGTIADALGVKDVLHLHTYPKPPKPDLDASLRARIAVASKWAPNASHADGFARGSVLVLHPVLSKIPRPETLRFLLAHELAHAAHDTPTLRVVPGTASALGSALFRGALLSAAFVGTAALPTVLVVVAGRTALRLTKAWASRRVEVAADRTAVAYTGQPEEAGYALDWLSRIHEALVHDLVEQREPAVLDLTARTWDTQPPCRRPGRLSRLLATHPTLDERLGSIGAPQPSVAH